MEERNYLTLKDKLFYGVGDFASNIFSVSVGSFVLVFLTNAVGLNSVIIGTIMGISRLLDGITDVLFGSLIDRTQTKMGKARPWMFWSTFLLGLFMVLNFTVPDLDGILPYAYFAVVYIVFNAICYTANNIAYSTLSALITRNPKERVFLGTVRYIFAFISVMVVSGFMMNIVNCFGGDSSTKAWRSTAIALSIVAIIINTISVLMVKELPPEDRKKESEEKSSVNLVSAIKLLISNKYYLCVVGIYISFYLATGILGGFGVYFTQYALENVNLMQPFSIATNMPTILALFFVPILVSKFGIYKTNKIGMLCAAIASIVAVVCGLSHIVPALVICLAVRSMCSASLMGTLNAVIARIAEYVYKKDGVHIEGSMFSCSSMGIKLGGGLGSALCGWMLGIAKFDSALTVQSAYTNNVITLTYCLIPAIFFCVIAVLTRGLDIEQAINKIDSADM